MDIFKDSTHESSVSNSLEIDRIKARVIGVWNQLMAATYEIEYKNQSSDDEDYVSLESFMEDNKLTFAGEQEEQSEIDSLLEMFDDMLDPKEELEPIESEAKAPTYGSTNLPSYNESLKVPKGTYDGSHTSTSTPKDSKEELKATRYEEPEPGKKLISKTHEVSAPTLQDLKDILKIERDKLLKTVAKNNRKYGVIL
tara:strand:- start:371 stop:961 length:591 start_codon:yes stop_codon:yes gene_type:complete